MIQVPKLKIKDSSEDDSLSIKFEILEETEGDLNEWVTVYKHTQSFTVTAPSAVATGLLTITTSDSTVEGKEQFVFTFS